MTPRSSARAPATGSYLKVGSRHTSQLQRILNLPCRRVGVFLHRQGFPVEGHLIQEQVLGGQHADIRGHHVPGGQPDDVPGHQQLQRFFHFLVSRRTVAVLLTIAWSFSAA